MSDLERVIKGLKCLATDGGGCHSDCPYYVNRSTTCFGVMAADALSLLEEQEAAKPAVAMTEIDFLDWLACSVVLADDFETNPGFFREVICRKLVRLGMLKLEDDKYVLPDPTKWRVEVSGDD